MTTLIEQIKADQVAARKGRATAKASLLTTLLGEASIIGKNAGRETTNDEVVAVVKKFIKNIDECLAVEKDELKLAALNSEKAILDLYLPAQLNPEQMTEIINKIAVDKGSPLDLKDIMSGFKAQFAGMFDGKVLSTIARGWLEANTPKV